MSTTMPDLIARNVDVLLNNLYTGRMPPNITRLQGLQMLAQVVDWQSAHLSNEQLAQALQLLSRRRSFSRPPRGSILAHGMTYALTTSRSLVANGCSGDLRRRPSTVALYREINRWATPSVGL